MLLNEFLPVYDVHERHEIIVRAPVEQVYASFWDINFGASRLVHGLFYIRSLPMLLHQGSQLAVPDTLTLNDFLKSGFILLAKQQNQEILLGWLVTSGRCAAIFDASSHATSRISVRLGTPRLL